MRLIFFETCKLQLYPIGICFDVLGGFFSQINDKQEALLMAHFLDMEKEGWGWAGS